MITTGRIFIVTILAAVALLAALVVSTNNSVYDKFTLPLKVEEYFDYDCPHCQDFEPTMKEVKQKYGSDVEVTSIYFQIFNSIDAAKAVEAAALQGKRTEFHDEIFKQIADKKVQSSSQVNFEEVAKQFKLDVKKFNQDRQGQAIADKLAKDKEDAGKRGVTATPTVFVNGVKVGIEADREGSFAPFLKKMDEIIAAAKAKK